jgi:hypothetical protein
MIDAGRGRWRWRGLVPGAVLAVAGLLLVSCGGEPVLMVPDGPSPAPAATSLPVASPSAMAATPVPEPPLGEVVWATAVDPVTSAPSEPVTAFAPDAPRIIAAVASHRLAAGSRLKATWEYNQTSLDAFTTDLIIPEESTGQWVNFQISRAVTSEPWPEGTYAIAIAVDGTVTRTAEVEVRTGD